MRLYLSGRRFAVIRKLSIIMAAALIFAAAVPALAAPYPNPDNLNRSILGFFTELAGMKSPEWMAAGTRVVYEITNENFADPTKDEAGFLVYDVVDVKDDYVASALSTSDEVSGLPLGLVYSSGFVDHPSIGRYWMSPGLFKQGVLSKEKSDLIYFTSITLGGEKYDVAVFSFESSTAKRTMAYDRETGLLLLVDMVIFDSAGKDVSQTVITYLGMRFAFTPWYGLNVEGLSTDTQLSYKAVYITDGQAEEQSLDFKVLENNGSWAVLDRVYTSKSGVKRTGQIISATSAGDLNLLWLPTDLLLGLKEGEMLFEEDLTSSTVKAMGLTQDKDFGEVRSILFIDRAVQTECKYSVKTGYMVSLHQKPLVKDIPEVIFTLVSVK